MFYILFICKADGVECVAASEHKQVLRVMGEFYEARDPDVMYGIASASANFADEVAAYLPVR